MRSASLPAVLPCLSVRECVASGSASGQTACPVCPTLHQSWFRHRNASPLRPDCPSPPWLPISTPPTSRDECLFFISLVSDFLAVQFSVSSGCARRRSVSTYAAILVLPTLVSLISLFLSCSAFLCSIPKQILLTPPTVCPESVHLSCSYL